MRSKDALNEDQQAAITFLYENDESFLVAPTGCGKTVVALTAMAELLAAGHIKRVLILAPLKVCETVWRVEAQKWEHLAHLEVGIATGGPEERESVIYGDAPIVAINEENLVWLAKLTDGKAIQLFGGIVIDETSHWTNVGSKKTGARFKALRYKMQDFSWRCGMTAQPVPEDWVGLYGQVLLLDLGKRFGRSKDRFMQKHFYASDYSRRKWEILPGQEPILMGKIRDLLHVMPDHKAEELPPKNVSLHYIDLDADTMKRYHTMRRHKVLKLPGNITIEAENQAVLSGKLEQIANGFSYIDHGEGTPRGVVVHHREKKDWIVNRGRVITAFGENLIIVYWFEEDLKWLRPAFPFALELAGGADVSDVMAQWNSGDTGQILFLHPASAGHGVDGLQESCCHELWVSPCWSRDKQEQTRDRLWRKGQTREVFIEICMARGTVDEIKLDAAEGKGKYHELFLAHCEEK